MRALTVSVVGWPLLSRAGVKRARLDFTYAKADTLIEHGDLLIVSGPTGHVETFAALD